MTEKTPKNKESALRTSRSARNEVPAKAYEEPPYNVAKEIGETIGIASAITLVGLGGWAAAQALDNPTTRQWAHDSINDAKERAFVQQVNEGTNGQYSEDSLIGEFTIESGGLVDPALTAISERYGDAVYKEIKPYFYDTLEASAKLQAQQAIPQPGDTYYVVAKDVDPKAEDGDEFFIVKPSQVHKNADDAAAAENN